MPRGLYWLHKPRHLWVWLAHFEGERKVIPSDSSFLILLDWHALFLSLVPVPLVDLALTEAELLGNASDVLAGPVWILFEFILKNLQLLLIFSLTTLDVAARCIAVLSLFKQWRYAIVEVIILKSEVGYIKELSELLVVVGCTSEHIWVSLSYNIIFFGFYLWGSSFMLADHHRLIRKVGTHSGAWSISAQAVVVVMVRGTVMSALLNFLTMVVGKSFPIGRGRRVDQMELKLGCRRDCYMLLYLLFFLLEAHIKLQRGWHLSWARDMQHRNRGSLLGITMRVRGEESTACYAGDCLLLSALLEGSLLSD